MKNALIIIPTYNEIENIEALLRAVFLLHPQVHILVVDDNSPDQTAYKVCGLQNDFLNKLFLLKRRSKSGLGKAYIAGFKWGLEHDYKYIFEMDADFSHDPNSLIMLYKACTEQGVDIAIGSRYKNGINVVNWPLSRFYCHTLRLGMYALLWACQLKIQQHGLFAIKERLWNPWIWIRLSLKGMRFKLK